MLKILGFSVVLVLLGVTSVCAAPRPPLTLEESFKLALENSDDIFRRLDELKIVEAQYRQQLALLYPSISILATERLQDEGSSVSSFDEEDEDDFDDIGRRNRREDDQFEGSLNIRHTLYNGFRDLYLAEALEKQAQALAFDRDRAIQLLFLEVSQVFLQIRYFESDLKILTETTAALDARLSELGNWIKLGKSRDSELLAAEAEKAELLVVEEQVKGLRSEGKEFFAFLVGIPSSELSLASDPITVSVPTVDSLVLQALERPDIKAARSREEAAQKELTAAQRGHYPSLTAEANAYAYTEPDLDRDWDIFLRLEVPLYQGGAIEASEREAEARIRASKRTISEVHRQIEREVRVAHSNLTSALSQKEVLRKLAAVTRKNYESQKNDYALGLVTNLDVLVSLRRRYDAERRYLEATFLTEGRYLSLKTALGDTTL